MYKKILSKKNVKTKIKIKNLASPVRSPSCNNMLTNIINFSYTSCRKKSPILFDYKLWYNS